jgi:hypothetical protein
VTYTKSGKELFLAVINDGQAAVSFLCLNAKLFNSRDPKRFRAAGESSGGHITAQLATTNKSNELIKHAFTQKASSAIQAASPRGGNTDFIRCNSPFTSSRVAVLRVSVTVYRIALHEHVFLARATNQLRRNSPVAKDIAPICTKFRGGIDES